MEIYRHIDRILSVGGRGGFVFIILKSLSYSMTNDDKKNKQAL